MTRITEVKIKNFQSHKDTKLSFVEGLNVIVGPSDQGKSAIIRAIKWVLYNEPRGSDFVRQGENSAKVSLTLSNGNTIIRERSSGKNSYSIVDPDGVVSVFEGFGTEVPQEVIKAHGIPKIVLDTDLSANLNLGGQMEGPFLLSESGAVRARAIGRLTGLHFIDKAIRDTATDLRRENQTRERQNGEIKEIEEKLSEYKDLELLKYKIDKSEEIIDKIDKINFKIQSLEKVRLKYKDIIGKILSTKDRIEKLKDINECEVVVHSISDSVKRVKGFESINKKLSDIMVKINEDNNVLRETKSLNDGLKIVKLIDSIIERHKRLQKCITELYPLQKDKENVNLVIQKTENYEAYQVCLTKAEADNIKLKKLSQIKEKMLSYESEIKKKAQFLETTKKILQDNSIESIEDKNNIIKKLETKYSKYMEYQKGIEEGKKYILARKEEIQYNLDEYVGILRKVGKCPLCQSTIGEEKLENIIKEYEEVY